MALAQRTGRSRHRLILLALTALTLLTLDLRGFGPAERAQQLVRDILNPVASVATTVVSPIGNAWNSVFHYGELKDENEALRRELDAAKGASIQGEADSATLQRFLEAADIPYIGDTPTVEARIVRGPVGNFADTIVTIDRGADDGIEVGMAVVTSAGLVGRVSSVDPGHATVQLLSDPDVGVGVRFVSTGDVGLGHAVAGESGRFVVDRGLDWPLDGDTSLLPAIGSAAVTAGGGASRYPADVPIGVVTAVEQGADEVSMVVTVALANELDGLEFVSILLVPVNDEFPLEPAVPSPSRPIRPVPTRSPRSRPHDRGEGRAGRRGGGGRATLGALRRGPGVSHRSC
ncbi:MAG: rod shape-determining protein MreC [Acidimicrobiales bacterium]